MTPAGTQADRSEDTPRRDTSASAAPASLRRPPIARFADVTRTSLAVADGRRLSALIATPPPGEPVARELPPILAVHGYASSAASGWGRTGHLEMMTRAGRVVLAVDLRGHGDSEKPHDTAAYSLDRMVADLAEMAEALPEWIDPPGQGAQFDVVGYSLGSRLSWWLARSGMLPIRRMVLGGFDGRPLFEGVDPRQLDRLAAWSGTNDRIALAALVTGLTGAGARPEGAPPGLPVLVVAGGDDPLATRAEEFVSGLPHGSFLTVPGRDHITTVPAKLYRERLVEFLARSR